MHDRYGVVIDGYDRQWRWSVDQRAEFWSAVWDFCDVISTARGDRVLVDGDRMPGAKWFPDARLNFAENLLRRRDDGQAIVFWNETGRQQALSFQELYDAAELGPSAR